MPANSLNSIALPSITGIAASGPMSPRPSTAVPSVTTATVFCLMVSAQRLPGSSCDGQADAGHARRVGHREVVAGLHRHLVLAPRSCRPGASGTCGRRRARSSTPSIAARRRRRSAAPCSASAAATVMSRTVCSFVTRTRSMAPRSPSASAIADATRANEPGPEGISMRSVRLYDAEGVRPAMWTRSVSKPAFGARCSGRLAAGRCPGSVPEPRRSDDLGSAVATKQVKPSDLDLNDEPAKAADVFLVDGNGLAYRAFYALPEELQTVEGQPTNALLGMANMLFKLLVDYRPKTVLVAWDERPEARIALSPDYKAGRKPTPELLKRQQPYFSPIVEAFGYTNFRVDGKEADDVIGTLSPDRGGRRPPRVRGLDRSRRLPAGIRQRLHHDDSARGGRRRRLHARPDPPALRHRPRPDPRLHRPQGRHLGQHPRGAGHRREDRRRPAGAVREPGGRVRVRSTTCRARSAASRCARRPKMPSAPRCSATIDREIPSRCRLPELVVSPPDRSGMKELFRKLEFRNLLRRVDELEVAPPGGAPECRDRARRRRLA